ncbi:urea ABC transporter permease subunit UrtB [Thermus islandicus]|uniref:urea ABC transporter permease subunit UrtB n=1 Tax=Thermus islandicus TaxID=540988 RepID=UPI0003B41202|nr:urea ABC transporter permease subunit UrtB [Thermus islandicus]
MGEAALWIGQVFNGLSVGSILIMTALGLAFSFGLMRVINMAHGEFLMLGGYLAFLIQQGMPSPYSPLLTLPLAFLSGALVGWLLESGLVRFLYGRPAETLLATWGISLVLQQAARDLFGPSGVEVTSPSWLAGALEIRGGALDGLGLPYVRFFVASLALLVLGLLGALLRWTRIGLHIRAVSQNREMAAALGIHTRAVDGFVFALGSGLAGLGGAALAFLAPVTPTVGQSYIVDAFLVVILGGLGSLGGTVVAGLLVGLASALLQALTSVSLAKVLLLLLVVLTLQVRPRGLVSLRSRALEEV